MTDMLMLGVVLIGGYYLIQNPGALDSIFSKLKLPEAGATPAPEGEGGEEGDGDGEEDEEEEDDKKKKKKDKDSKYVTSFHGVSMYPHEDPSHLTGLFSAVNAGVIPTHTSRFASLRRINIG